FNCRRVLLGCLAPRPSAALRLNEDHFNAIGIRIGDLAGVADLAQVLVPWKSPGAVDRDRPAVVHSQAPLSDIEMMGAKIGHLPAAIVPDKAEVVLHVVLVVLPPRLRAEPHAV